MNVWNGWIKGSYKTVTSCQKKTSAQEEVFASPSIQTISMRGESWKFSSRFYAEMKSHLVPNSQYHGKCLIWFVVTAFPLTAVDHFLPLLYKVLLPWGTPFFVSMFLSPLTTSNSFEMKGKLRVFTLDQYPLGFLPPSHLFLVFFHSPSRSPFFSLFSPCLSSLYLDRALPINPE